MKFQYLRSIWILMICLCAFSAHAEQGVNVLPEDPAVRLILHDLVYLKDTSHLIPLRQIATGKYDSLWQPQQSRVLSFKYSAATYWIRMVVKNPSAMKRNIVLDIGSSNIEDLSLYRLKGDTLVHFGSTGTNYNYNPDHVYNGDYFYPLTLQANEQVVYYLKAQNDLPSLRIPMFLWDQPQFTRKQHLEGLGWGIFFGIMIIIIFFNLTVYYFVRDSINLYYVVYVFALLLYQLQNKSQLFEFLFPRHPEYNWPSLLTVSILTIVCHLRFSQVFLPMKELSRRVYQFLNVIMLCMFVFPLCWIFREHLGNGTLRLMIIQSFNWIPLLAFIGLAYVTILGIKRGDYSSYLYLLAFTPLITFNVLITMRNNNLFPYFSILDYRIPIGFSFELIVLSFALAYRFKILKDEKEKLILENAAMQMSQFKAVIEATESERKRIAQDLHDGLGQLLSTAKLNVSSMEDSVHDDDRQQFENSMSLIDEACQEVRHISHNMMPSTLIRMGLLPALKELVDKACIPGQMQVQLQVNGLTNRLDEASEVAIYRVVQETVNNAIKYSGASIVKVLLEKTDKQLRLEITDNGKGFDTAAIGKSEGIGWRSIYSRVAMLNGNISVESGKGKGTRIVVVVG